MFWLTTSIIVFCVAFVAIIVYEEGFTSKCLLAFLALLLIIPSFLGNVPTGQVGIKTSFGKVINTHLDEGINIKAPWEKIVLMDARVQKYENEAALETSTKDLQIVNNIVVSINYQLAADKVAALYKQVGEKYKLTILEPAIQETVKGTMSKYTASELVTIRSEVALVMSKELNNRMSKYGITISSVSLKNFDFSKEYNASIERKAVAEQNALTAQQELETAKAEAEKKKIQAQGEAEANKIKQSTITDDILTQQFIEKWDGKLPIVASDGNIMDISGLIK